MIEKVAFYELHLFSAFLYSAIFSQDGHFTYVFLVLDLIISGLLNFFVVKISCNYFFILNIPVPISNEERKLT